MGQSEADVERSVIKLLEEQGWRYRPELKSEKDLWNHLRDILNSTNQGALKNVPITDKEWEDIVSQIKEKTKTPYEASRWLRGENGRVSLRVEREDMSRGCVELEVYYPQSMCGGMARYEVVNQITCEGTTGRKRRFDITLLISGLPMAQIELKTLEAKDGFLQAFYQVKKYAKEGVFSDGIYNTLQLFVISNVQRTRYFVNSDSEKMEKKSLICWRTPENVPVEDIYNFTREFLNVGNFQQMLTNFMVLHEDGYRRGTMVLRPYQVHAIRRIYRAVSEHESGYVWHATGSGKTLTCFVATKLLSRKVGVDRTIMLVDRKDLDQQTTMEFSKFAPECNTGNNRYKNTLIVGTDDVRDLERALMSDVNRNSIIITTRQKLSKAIDRAQNEAKRSADAKTKFNRLLNSHVVFIVDECHRAISATEEKEVKSIFPRSTWIGFTGTPIFEENKKQEVGQSPRTTEDQYGPCLHSYTIENALEDGAVLAFQVEHETTIRPKTLNEALINVLETEGHDRGEAVQLVKGMPKLVKESKVPRSVFERDDHIEAVVRKVLDPDSAFVRFGFRDGKPTMSAILTTSSIAMAKRYYDAFKKYKAQDKKEQSLLQGRYMDDPDFPRIAVTYTLEENDEGTPKEDEKMLEILADYNEYYHTEWNLSSIQQYNGEVNNRLARKKGSFQDFGKHLDLVIVVDRLLTGFDAPSLQTLFVDRNLTYAGLIQAFSRTNRTYQKDGWVKEKGIIVTFRNPETMKKNVEDATLLYANEKVGDGLIYPDYKTTREKFFKAYDKFMALPAASDPTSISEHSPHDEIEEYVKCYQALQRCHRALSTYDEYAKDMTASIKALRKEMGEGDAEDIATLLEEAHSKYEVEDSFVLRMNLLERHQGTYLTLKKYIQGEDKPNPNVFNFKEISFYDDYDAEVYDVDTRYIHRLLEQYPTDTERYRKALEKALKKSNKPAFILDMYREVLDRVDAKDLHGTDIVHEKNQFFKDAIDAELEAFAAYWYVSREELEMSRREYLFSDMEEPQTKGIVSNCQFETLIKERPEIGTAKFKVISAIKHAWIALLNERLKPMYNELR